MILKSGVYREHSIRIFEVTCPITVSLYEEGDGIG